MFSRLSTVLKRAAFIALGLVASVGTLRAAEVVTYYYTSLQGTVLATTDGAGNVVSTTDYRPYGSQVLGSPMSGPAFTGHVSDVESGLIYMQQRYYDPAVGRFVTVDPVDNAADSNRYWYANANPYKFIDPDGRLARGSGFTDDQWKAFDKAQQRAAANLERASARITSVLESGKGMAGLQRSFERAFGKGSATQGNMAKVAGDMSSMAAALRRTTGPDAIIAEGMTSTEIRNAYGNDGSTLAGVPSRGDLRVIVNVTHPSYNDVSKLSWAAGHEMAHAVLGYNDKYFNGSRAYKFGFPEERESFHDLPSSDRMTSPDHLMDFSQ